MPSRPRRIDDGPLASQLDAPRPGRVGRTSVALSLGRIMVLNVLALAVTALATAHVIGRARRPAPTPNVAPPSVAAGHAPASSPTPSAWLGAAPGVTAPIEVDVEPVGPGVAPRSTPSPSVNGGSVGAPPRPVAPVRP